MNKLIQWPRAKYWDKAWNPIVGCRAVSPACEHCWAREWMGRFPQYGGSFEPRRTKAGGPPRTGVVFCGNMTDLFGEFVAENPLFSRFGRDATYLWLTKRPEDMVACMRSGSFHETFDEENHYFGITGENASWLEIRLRMSGNGIFDWPVLAKGWLSLEPLLGPVDLHRVLREFPFLKWVVVGCESGRERRPCKIEWVEAIVEECRAAEVPVFVKQLDLGGRVVTDIERFPAHLRVRQVPWAGRQGEKG